MSRIFDRRVILKSAIAAAIGAPALRVYSATDGKPLVLGQSAALTGPLADLGKAMSVGSHVYFDALNAKGGIKGRPVKLTTLDDAYDVKRSQENITKLLEDRNLLGLFTLMGTPMIEAALPMLRSTGTMLFAPFSGALSSRPKALRSVLPIRASYPEEAAQVVKHLTTLGLKKIALVTQANSFGDEVLAGALAAMESKALKPLAQSKVKSDASDAAEAALAAVSSGAKAVIIGLAGKPALEYIKAIRAKDKGMSLYSLSILGAAGTIKAMGEAGIGVTLSQVVPTPAGDAIPLVSEFRKAFAEAKVDVAASHLALEGYINAKVFSSIVGRMSGPISGSAIIDAAWATKKLDLGGFNIGFTEPGKSASDFIELTMISSSGFVR